nr:MAG TPA: hypothetical protein [Caudoviricetes sp.]
MPVALTDDIIPDRHLYYITPRCTRSMGVFFIPIFKEERYNATIQR